MKLIMTLHSVFARQRLAPGHWLICCLLLAVFGLQLAHPGIAVAQAEPTAPVCEETDREESRLSITCSPGFASARDAIQVYFLRGPVPDGEPGQDDAFFQNAVWIFDAYADGTANLVIRFVSSGEHARADVFDDQNGDAEVTWSINNRQLSVDEASNFFTLPTLSIIAHDGWWIRGDQVNYNLDITVDGPVEAAWAAAAQQRGFVTDGENEFVMRVRDTNNNGRPEQQLVQYWPDGPKNGRLYRTHVLWNVADNEHPLRDALFWPFLRASGETYGDCTVVKGYGPENSTAPIEVDWEASRIACFNEIVTSRGHENNWFAYSIQRLGQNEEIIANWETPFTFYDMANDQDGYPELISRVVYWPAFDNHFERGIYPIDIQLIRYSWDQTNDGYLDYKLGLAGSHQITATLRFPDLGLSFRALTYEEVPEWIIDHDWSMATFVAIEAPFYRSSEGIYTWDIGEQESFQYLAGHSASVDPFLERMSWIERRARGEYTHALDGPPRLYFSPLDRKLHLQYAETGMWNIDGNAALYYDNLNGDAYIDQWVYLELQAQDAEARQRRLTMTHDHLIYSDSEQVIVQHTPTPPSSFEARPPTNHQEWTQLGRQIERYDRELEPGAFIDWMAQFSGPSTQLVGATLRDFRFITDQSFRFVLSLSPEYQVSGAYTTLFDDLPPDDYVLTYDDDGDWTITELTPYDLDLHLQLHEETAQFQQLSPQAIEVTNSGLADAYNIQVRATAQFAGEATEVMSQTIDILGEHARWVPFEWQPVQIGTWTLTVWLENQHGAQLAQVQEQVRFDSLRSEDTRMIVRFSSGDSLWWKSPLILFLLMITTMVVAYVAFTYTETKE